jgi:hypothetical protein
MVTYDSVETGQTQLSLDPPNLSTNLFEKRDRWFPCGENFRAHRQKGRGLIGGLTPNDN